ncbi:methyltransferase domain-containing protein [Mycena pura]|uniref:Methyltransferase domain-containing protein n=1 Tax=Mycena pura TaxID=153505 RepID=A0AAD6Y5Q4_9AGAR|nr:methyltransferase domain-containing protein [Mycena pura]
MTSALDAACAVLASPLVAALLATHPNDLAAAPVPPPVPFRTQWWLQWATSDQRWTQLLEYYLRKDKGKGKANDVDAPDAAELPAELRALVDQLCALALPRDPIAVTTPADAPPLRIDARGMSPKKAHEVTRSVAYINNLLRSLNLDPRAVRIVDIGAGQGYLTRALQTHLGTLHLLALDASPVQTAGAARREARTAAGSSGKITQKTIHVTPATLCAAVDEWVGATGTDNEPVPVLLVALHACGSLTPDILRAFFAQRERERRRGRAAALWNPIGVIAIGCCYNLLAPQDFPLSAHLRTASPPLSLPGSAYHLATQIPAHWRRSEAAWVGAALAVRKVVWRAVVGRRVAAVVGDWGWGGDGDGDDDDGGVPSATNTHTYTHVRTLGAGPAAGTGDGDDDDGGVPSATNTHTYTHVRTLGAGPAAGTGEGTGDRPVMRRLGRLNDAVYADWADFVRAAGARLTRGADHNGGAADHDLGIGGALSAEERRLINELGVLHVLRCLVGPLVESMIIGDRAQWIREQLGGQMSEDGDGLGDTGTVEAVNLFDQATGSGRNVALVVVPTKGSDEWF